MRLTAPTAPRPPAAPAVQRLGGPARAAPWLPAALLAAAIALPAWAAPDAEAPATRAPSATSSEVGPASPLVPAPAAVAAGGGVGAAGDAILQLLQDRGLLPDAEAVEQHPALRQVRDAASDLVLGAMNFLGVRYKRGGNSADEGFDCSGFTRHVFENSLGLVLPRRAEQQASLAGLMQVARDELRPGDLVFFNTMRRAFSHVGIYVGDGKFIHAPRSGANVRIEDMREAYWTRRFNGARRADVAAVAPAVADPAALPRR